MAAQVPTLPLLLLWLGMWAVPSHGRATLSLGAKPRLQLSGDGHRCSGMLEVQREASWSRLCWDSSLEAFLDGTCRQLGCGPSASKPLQAIGRVGKEPQMRLEGCWRPATELARCLLVPANCTHHIFLNCSEPVNTTPEPTPVPPSTTLEPTGPPRLLLVDGDVPCSGFLELHKEGLWGAVASSPSLWPRVATEICRHLGCGPAAPSGDRGEPEPGSLLPVSWEVLEPCGSPSVLSCFGRTGRQRGKPPAFITCEGSRALRRLGGGATPCEGEPEVFHRGRWQGLCDSREQRARRGQQLCQELQCGNLSSSTKSQAPPALGVACRAPSLHLCPGPLDPLQMCSRTRVVCQDSKPQPVGTPAGTIVSICLALLLLGILLLICGPPAYRRLVKRISKKKQRQWIGPTGLSQTVSFHRNSTVSRRPRAEGQRGQGGDNDYAQPPQRSSCLSAYPALEGACRASNPADNSSDSDYDLSSARRV